MLTEPLAAAERPTLRTPRLVLRPFRIDDGPAVERIAGRFEIADTTTTVPHPYPAGGGAAWIATHADAWNESRRLTLAVAFADAPDDVVAAVGLGTAREHRSAELGYWVAVEHWGRGIATEASRALLEYGFGEMGLHRIQARHLARNAASGRVMEKLGMRREGVLRGALRKWERNEDVVLYAALAAEWPARADTAGPSLPAALLQLQRLARHMAWADSELVAALETAGAALPAVALREYAHVLGAEEVWLARLESRPAHTAVWPELDITELAPLAALVRAGYARHIGALAEDDLGRQVHYANSAGRTFDTAAGDILLHVALHGQYHRGKVNRMLREAGLEPAPVDFIAFVRGVPAATTATARPG